METFDGFMFSKLHLIGSKSEGPVYFLQSFDYRENIVIKQTHPWKEDPNLQKFLAKKVTIEGQVTQRGIAYKQVMPYKPSRKAPKGKTLELALKTGEDVLWINKMPPGPHPPKYMDLTLLVKWPYRSIWTGTCPSSQIYEFTIEHDGKIIWRWSDDKMFLQVMQPVCIPGGDFQKFNEIWKVNPDDIESEGIYTARGLFIASGQEASKEFEIKFAH